MRIYFATPDSPLPSSGSIAVLATAMTLAVFFALIRLGYSTKDAVAGAGGIGAFVLWAFHYDGRRQLRND